MIQRVELNIKLDVEENAFLIQQKLTEQTKRIVPDVVKTAETKNKIPNDTRIFIPKIEIDLGNISKSDYIQVFGRKLRQALANELESQIRQSKTLKKIQHEAVFANTPLKIEQSYRIAVHYFLNYGVFPWWFSFSQTNLATLLLKYATESPQSFRAFMIKGSTNEKLVKILRVSQILSLHDFFIFFEKTTAPIGGKLKTILAQKLEKNEIKTLLAQSFLKTDNFQKQNAQETIIVEIAQTPSILLKIKDLANQLTTDKKLITLIETARSTTQTTNLTKTENIRPPTETTDIAQIPLAATHRQEQAFRAAQQTEKKLLLELFDYEFNQALLFYFFTTGQFYPWAKELIQSVKAQNKLRSNFDFALWLFNFLKTKWPQQFQSGLLAFFEHNETITIFRSFPTNFVFQILLILFREKNEAFLQLNSQLRKQYSQQQVTIFMLENYSNLITDLSWEYIEQFNLNIQPNNDAISKSVTDLIMHSELNEYFGKISTEDLQAFIQQSKTEYWQKLLEFNRYLFVIEQFPDKSIILLLQKLLTGRFRIISEIWLEIQLILKQAQIIFETKQLSKLFYKIAFEIYFSEFSEQSAFIQKHFKSLNTYFSTTTNFELRFLEALTALPEKQISKFKQFRPDAFFFTGESQLLATNTLTEASILSQQLLFYLRFGYIHWSAFTQNFTEFAKAVAKIFSKILPENQKTLGQLLKAAGVQQRLELILGKESFLFYIKRIDSKLDKKTAYKPTLSDTALEEVFNEKLDWVNEAPAENKYYVKNAGLIVLANFFTFFFKRLKLIEKKGKTHQFKNTVAQERAVILTQYLATGNENFKEHEMLLNKILCGWDIHSPIRTDVKLSEAEKTETELLIQSAIKHWSVLGSTTTDGLRKTFIEREGLVTFKNSAYHLKVEQKAIDILLTKLPWTFQTLKFSWNKYLILTQWQT